MKKMVAFLGFTLAASVASAQSAPVTRVQDDGTSVDEALLASASEADRTAETTLGTTGRRDGANWGKVRVEVDYTYGGAGITDLTVTPYCKRSLGSSYATYAVRDCSTTQCAVVSLVDTFESPSASFVTTLEYDVRGCNKFKVVVAGTGSPDAADAVTVAIVKVAGE
jgi:hypothetical protein